MDRNKIPHDPRHLEVPLGVSKMISEPMVCLAQTVQLSSDKITTISKWNKMSFHLSFSPRSTIRCVQNNFWACGMFSENSAPILPQDYHYLQTDRNELPLEHRQLVVPSSASKMISEPMVLLSQLCTYLALPLTLSPNEPKRDSTWASSPRSTVGCVQTDLSAYGRFSTNYAPILHGH
jgi:hypothetical protein